MIKTYFKIAFRNLWKNKTFTFINLAGLTVGLTCVILMVLYIQHELSYDKFQKNADRIVRVTMEYSMGGGEPRKIVVTSTKVLPAFKRVFPEIEDGVRLSGGRPGLIKYQDKVFIEPGFIHADSTFFSVFSSFKLLKGTADQVLKAPNMLVISESAAKKFFGNDDPVGKTLQIGAAQTNYLVTGVAEDCPSNSQIKFNFLASFSSLGPAQENTYFNANYITYFLLKDKGAIASLQPKIAPFMKKDMTDADMTFHLEPYTSVHLHSELDGYEPNSNINYIYITGGVALLILIIACFTYVNLSTARSMERAKEVGIRKVSGAFRSQVFWQFIGESSIITAISLILSFVLAAILLPSFNELAERSLSLNGLFRPSILVIALLILTTISLLAGSYPALILSRFQPVKVLKGAFRNSSSGTWIRKSLTVFQFTVSAFLIIATFVLQRQLNYIQTKKLGYDRDHIVVLPMDSRINEKTELFKTTIRKNPEVLAVSKSYNTPINIVGGYSMSNSPSNENAMSVKANPIDEDYIKVNNLEIIAGTDLSRQDLLDINTAEDTAKKPYFHYVLNESAAAALGWKPEEAIGKKMFLGNQRPGEVKAVIKDFHFASLHSAVEPLVLFPDNWGSVMQVKMTGNNMSQTIAHLEKTWKELAPHRPFQYTFMDEDYNKMYASEMRTGDIFKVFSTIAILLACMGLFGLSAYSVQQKTKEIGIRKVLGASSARITLSLVNQFIKLVLVSFVIAVPVAWILSEKWLSSFVYRTDIPLYIFLIAGLSITFVALFTVGTQALRAALSNPVKSLRTE
ncbi:MAG: ABC transporter permease [Chitinophagaceae bacterium]